MRSKKGHAGLSVVIAAVLMFAQLAQLFSFDADAHRLPEAEVYSRYSQVKVTVDGNITAAEWSTATVVGLSPIPFNTLDAYLLLQNNDTTLHMAYDAVGDLTNSTADSAGLAFDGDHNGAPTSLGDHEFSVSATNDSACAPFSTTRCHYTYSGPGDTWAARDPMNPGLPFQAGLWAGVGFGPSPRSSTAHRTYEFSVPLALLGRPTKTVKPGDVLGFYAGRHVSPEVGVWDGDASTSAAWPDNAPLGPNGYGHLYLASVSRGFLSPDYSLRPATISQPAVHSLTLTNSGTASDRFDFLASSSLGWMVMLFDNMSSQLTDHGGNASLPDIGPLMPMANATVVALVTPPLSASPGSVDLTSLEVRPWSSPTMSFVVSLRSTVPLTAPWLTDLEGGLDGWYVLSREVNDWAHGIPNPGFPGGPLTAHSGTSVWGTNLNGNYSLSSFSILETPFVYIPDYAATAILTFYQWYDILGPYGDGAWVEVTADGGQWSLIEPVGLYPSRRFGGQEAYDGTTGGWRLAEFNLTALLGKSVAFRLIMWDWLPNGQRAGWYVDDFAVQFTLPPAGVRMTPTSTFMVGSRLSSLEVKLRIQNVGVSTDVFDLNPGQVLFWPMEVLDDLGQPLRDTETPRDGFVDTGPVPSGGYVNVTLNVTIPVTAVEGEVETVTLVFVSSLDISVSVSGKYNFQAAFAIPFFDDVESGLSGWTADPGSFWHQVDSCQPSPPAWFISYSPCHSWWFGQDIKGNYDTGSRVLGNLTSPPIALSGATSARLTFRYWYETELSTEYDQRWIMVKLDNGPWPNKGEPGSFLMDQYFEQTWLSHSLNFTQFIGHIVQVRFFFDSRDGHDNKHQGWYVDDINVSSYTPGSVPPNIAFMRPMAGDRWTAAVPQNVYWTVSDDADPPSSLKVWVNYSLSGSAPWSPVGAAQGVSGDSSPVVWTPPCVNITNAALNASIVDTFGLLSWTGAVPMILDCARPSVLSWEPSSPSGASVKSNATVVFSEAMNVTLTQAAFSLKMVQGWKPVAGTFSWSGNRLYFDPTGDLAALTTYQMNVTTNARDASEPGNRLASPFEWQFTTNAYADTAPTVSLSSPVGSTEWSGSRPGNPVSKSISWTIMDDFDPQEDLKVWVNYSIDGGQNWTTVGGAQPFNGTVDEFVWQVPGVDTMNATVLIEGMDTGGRVGRAQSQQFEIDATPPTVLQSDPTGYVVPPFADIRVQFSEPMNHVLAEGAFSLKRVFDPNPALGAFRWVNALMIFDPLENLVRGARYQVNITTLAKDSSDPGNRISSAVGWEFGITEAPPLRVNKTSPTNGSTGVSVDLRSIEITFTYPPSLVFAGAVNITPRVNFTIGQVVGYVLVVRIWEQLQYETKYTVLLNATKIRDRYGNYLDGNGDEIGGDDYLFTFTTSKTSGPVEPQITSLMWGVLLAILGFVIAVAVYQWRIKREEKDKEKKSGDIESRSPYEETIGPEEEVAAIEAIEGLLEEPVEPPRPPRP